MLTDPGAARKFGAISAYGNIRSGANRRTNLKIGRLRIEYFLELRKRTFSVGNAASPI